MPRLTDWVDTRVGLTVTAGSQDNTRVDGGSVQTTLRGITIVRTILAFGAFSTSVAGAWGIQQLDMAIGIVTREAFNAGIFPDPNSATDKPARGWIWYGQMLVSQNGVGTKIVHTLNGDIRGARKIENGVVVFIVNNTSLAGTNFSVQIRGLVRTLVKLP